MVTAPTKIQLVRLVLDNPSLQTFQRISWLVVAINFFALLFLAWRFFGSPAFYLPLTGAVLLTVFVVYSFNKKKNKPGYLPVFLIPFIISAITWLLMANYLMALAMIIVLVIEKTKQQKLELIADEEMITYPSIPRKKFYWDEISNMILKDGLLTIDFKNNKLVQVHITEAKEDEVSINDFFKNRLSEKQVTIHT